MWLLKIDKILYNYVISRPGQARDCSTNTSVIDSVWAKFYHKWGFVIGVPEKKKKTFLGSCNHFQEIITLP